MLHFFTDWRTRHSRRLIHAANSGDLEQAAQLLRKGADPSFTDEQGETALRRCGSVEIAALLLSHGASVNHQNNQGLTALHYAAMIRGGHELVRFLLQHGADPGLRSKNGWTPVDTACHFHKTDRRKEIAMRLWQSDRGVALMYLS